VGNLFERQLDSDAKVLAAVATSTAAAAAAHAEEILEHGTATATAKITHKSAKGIADIETFKASPEPTETGSLPHTGMTVLVVHLPLLGVFENLVRLGGFLELLLGVLVTLIAVRVKLHGQSAVGRLYRTFVGSPVNTEDLVVISF
jgi:hypothetical protein